MSAQCPNNNILPCHKETTLEQKNSPRISNTSKSQSADIYDVINSQVFEKRSSTHTSSSDFNKYIEEQVEEIKVQRKSEKQIQILQQQFSESGNWSKEF